MFRPFASAAALLFPTLAVAGPLTLETAPPVVVKTVPQAGSVDVDPSLAKLEVTFSKPMTDGSWSWTGGGPSFPELAGQPSYSADGRTCTLPVTLEPGTTYVIGINSKSFRNFKDADGRPAMPSLLVFRTAEEF